MGENPGHIHNNPVKAGMITEMSDYKYSSYNEFLNEKSIITDESIKILFGDIMDYKILFKLIHNSCVDEDFIDEDNRTEDVSTIIKKFEKKYNRKIEDVCQDKDLLKRVVNEAREQTNVTILELAKILNVSKSKIGRYAKKSWEMGTVPTSQKEKVGNRINRYGEDNRRCAGVVIRK